MDQARLHTEEQAMEDSVLVTVTGEIDVTTTGILAKALDQAADVALIVVADLTAVTFMDSTGISTLLHAHHALADQGGRLALTGAQSSVRRVLEMTGVDTVIPLHPNLAQALHP